MKRISMVVVLGLGLVSGTSQRAAWAAGSAADTMRVRLGDGIQAFVAVPPGEGPSPGIVVYHEWWGLNPQIREVAVRLAKQGYVAVVPDLYHGKVALNDPEQAHVLMRGLDEARAVAEGDLAVKWLRSQTRTAKGRIGVIGFCMGGSLAQRLALQNSGLAAVVMFYGTPETDPAALASLHAPLQGHFGADDSGIPADKVKAFQAALARAGKLAEIHVYPGAGHAFMHEGRPSFRADAARQAWARTLNFLQKRLKD